MNEECIQGHLLSILIGYRIIHRIYFGAFFIKDIYIQNELHSNLLPIMLFSNIIFSERDCQYGHAKSVSKIPRRYY